MGIKSLFKRFAGRQRPRSRARRRVGLGIEHLEPRILLDGNVAAIVQDGTLTIQGDNTDNRIQVTVAPDGVIVRGLDGTTVNGSSDDFLAFAGAVGIDGGLVCNMGHGDDIVLLDAGLSIAGDVQFGGGNGDDQLGLDGVTLGGNLQVHGNDGNDGVLLADAMIVGDVKVSAGNGLNTIFAVSSTIDGDLKISAGRGADAVHLDETTIGEDLRVQLHSGADGLYVEDSTVGGEMRVKTGRGSDFAMVEASTIGGTARFWMSSSVDSFVVTGTSIFADDLKINGGRGGDTQDVAENTDIAGRFSVHRFEHDDVPGPVIVDKLNAPQTGIRTRSSELRDLFDGLV